MVGSLRGRMPRARAVLTMLAVPSGMAQTDTSSKKSTKGQAEIELVPGVNLKITELRRLEDIGVLQLLFEVENGTGEDTSMERLGLGAAHGLQDIGVIDFASRTRYAKGYAGGCLCSVFVQRDGGAIPAGETREYWAWFGLPGEDASLLAVQFAGLKPILNVPVAE